MKFLKKFISTLMVTVLIVLNAPPPSLIAYAATECETIASKVFEFESANRAHGIFCWRYTEQVDVNGSTKTAYTVVSQCAVDPRITGTVDVLWGYQSYSYEDFRPLIADENNHYQKRISELGGYRGLQITVEYTPSEEDISNGVRVLAVIGDNSYWTGDIAKCWDGISYDPDGINGSYYPHLIDGDQLVAGTKYRTFSVGNAYGIVLGDVYTYLTTGNFIVDPTSSFASTAVTKKYGDVAFSAGFTTDSDGTVSYSSSNQNVATISSTGAITIKGVGTTTITASTSETASYCADSKTMTLTVTKGTLSVSAIPTATSIQYGQTISSSNISGGTIKDQANNTITGGTWSWKSPNTTPSGAGTIQCVAVYTLNNSNYE